MPISRIVLRLEIHSNADLVESLLSYEVPDLDRNICNESDEYENLTDIKKESPSSDNHHINFLGCRKFNEISIESYHTQELSEEEIMDLNMITNVLEEADNVIIDTSGDKDEKSVNITLSEKREDHPTSPMSLKTEEYFLKESEFSTDLSDNVDMIESSKAAQDDSMYISISSDLLDKTKMSCENEIKTEKVHASHHARSPSPAPTYFFSGNPSVEKTEGIMHLYKENQMISLTENVTRSEMICMLSVPASMTSPDLLQFTAPVEPWIECMKIIRDRSPNLYMVLIKFRNQKYADEFYSTYNNQPFNNIESECCHLAYVSRVESFKSCENDAQIVAGCTELPTCPVCLERMDESVDGILTILCNHTFHSSCLAQWGDTSCPVCRYVQTPEQDDNHTCFTCQAKESLWICLVCGSVGCGRYDGGHSFKHFEETQHAFAMELINSRVWDYSSDNYVHRLVQSKGDGKPVEVGNSSEPVEEEKIDSITLEYTYLLTSQLAAQRNHYEEKIKNIEKAYLRQIEDADTRTKKSSEENDELQQSNNLLSKDKSIFEKRCQLLSQKINKLSKDLEEEKSLNHSLRVNQGEWQKKIIDLQCDKDEKDQQIKDLQDQVRDIMFYMEAQQKLSNTELASQEEIQEGQVLIGSPAGSSKKSRKKGR